MTSEADFLDQLIAPATSLRPGLATILGWDCVHFRPARTEHGWVTPVQGSLGAGWPDLVLVRDGRCLFVELKSDAGKVAPEQHAVHAALLACGLDVRVWRPSQIGEIAAVLA